MATSEAGMSCLQQINNHRSGMHRQQPRILLFFLASSLASILQLELQKPPAPRQPHQRTSKIKNHKTCHGTLMVRVSLKLVLSPPWVVPGSACKLQLNICSSLQVILLSHQLLLLLAMEKQPLLQRKRRRRRHADFAYS